MSNKNMKRDQKMWESKDFSPEVNKIIEDNFYLIDNFYQMYKIYDRSERDFLMDRFLIACKRHNSVKDIFEIKKFLSACLYNSRMHYTLNKIRNNRNCKLYCELTDKEEQEIYELSEKYFNMEEDKGKTPKEIFAHQFICNLKPKHQKLLYYKFYYNSGEVKGLSWQGVAKMMNTSRQSVNRIFNTIQRLSDEEIFIDCGSDGYGTKILNTRTMKIRDKNPKKDLFDIFKEIEKGD